MAQKPASVGERLREIRSMRRLSQNDLAVQAELHPSTVSRIECGLHDPTLDTLRSLACALGVKLDRLAG